MATDHYFFLITMVQCMQNVKLLFQYRSCYKASYSQQDPWRNLILTVFPSLHLVSITIIVTLCSQVIRQKSSTVPGSGPWLAMYSRSYVYPYIQWMYLSTRKILYDVFNCLYLKSSNKLFQKYLKYM